jgi:hypothetical protein
VSGCVETTVPIPTADFFDFQVMPWNLFVGDCGLFDAIEKKLYQDSIILHTKSAIYHIHMRCYYPANRETELVYVFIRFWYRYNSGFMPRRWKVAGLPDIIEYL